ARLERFADAFPDAGDWQNRLRDWWLKHPRSATIPGWDFISTCEIDGKRGLVLIEAAADQSELNNAGMPVTKRKSKEAQLRSDENDEHIRGALEFASSALNSLMPGTTLSADDRYELSSRVAHAWWLANNGIPVVLMYLGFLHDQRAEASDETFTSQADWLTGFENYCRGILPDGFTGRWVDCGLASFYVLANALETARPKTRAS
ncbi:MAG TPA: hypothetical protein VK864_11570, partial [Longimicrobiales bacterium]|nr:hypothetical protein [Longimicrobiales bacterium]